MSKMISNTMINKREVKIFNIKKTKCIIKMMFFYESGVKFSNHYDHNSRKKKISEAF